MPSIIQQLYENILNDLINLKSDKDKNRDIIE